MDLNEAYTRDPAYRAGRIDALRAQIALLQGLLDEAISAQPERPAFAMDPAFSPDNLRDERWGWRDRLLATFGDGVGKTYPDVNVTFGGVGMDSATYCDAVAYGSAHIIALLWALDGTGDPLILAEVWRLANRIDHTRLVNANDLKESYIVMLFALISYVFRINALPESGRWLDLTLERLAKRGGIVGNEGLAQCAINNALAAQCLWLITEDAAYKAVVEERVDRFRAHFLYDATRGLWYHAADNAILTYESPTWWGEKWGAQSANYARYDVAGLLTLARLGCEVLPPALIAERVGEMYRDDGTIALRLDGTDAARGGLTYSWSKGRAGWVISAYALCGLWSDRVHAKSIEAWESVPGHERMPFVPAAMISQR